MIGIGIDAVDVERFRSIVRDRPSVLERLFSEAEREYCLQHRDSAASFAARFAAKEALMKALGVGLGAFNFHDVEVVRSESGKPDLVVRGEAEKLAQEAGVNKWHLSLTHTDLIANAIVVAE